MKQLSLILLLIAFKCFLARVTGLYTGPFQHSSWAVIETEKDPDKSVEVNIFISLAVENIEELKVKLREISDPQSPKYGHILSAAEVSKLSSPSEKIYNDVVNWLLTGNIQENQVLANRNRDMILVQKATVLELEELFNTTLEWHGNVVDSKESKKFLKATKELYIPGELNDAISFISLNNPILKSVKPAPTLHEAQKHSGPGVLRVLGKSNTAIVKFCLFCWDEENASPLCNGDYDPISVEVKVVNIDSHFPPAIFSVPWGDVECRAAAVGTDTPVPCDPFNATDPTAPTCTCGALVGPLTMYSELDFSAKVKSNYDAGGAVQTVEHDLGSSPQPFLLIDVTTPSFLKNLYNIPEYATVRHGATVATPEIAAYYSKEDLLYQAELSGIPPEFISLPKEVGDLPVDYSNPSLEPTLDVQFIATIALNASFTYYSIADCHPHCTDGEGFLKWLFFVSSQEKPEQVHGVSYIGHEAVQSNSSDINLEFFNRVDYEFIKLGLQGSTVVWSSGDNGVCSFTLGKVNTKACETSVPEWPNCSPYVTSVGATMLSDKYLPICGSRWSNLFELPIQCSGVGEVGVQAEKGTIITSGGGFSFVYDRPWWQDKHVSEYLKHAGEMEGFPTTPGFFNPEGRGYPDIAVYGANYAMVMGMKPTFVCGTSASAPFMAALVTLLNDQLLGEGFSPIGFFNPLLYYLRETRSEVFNDITIGKNACREGHIEDTTPLDCSEEFFTARPGWDPIGGIGSFNFGLMAEAVLDVARKSNQKKHTVQQEEDKKGQNFQQKESSSLGTKENKEPVFGVSLNENQAEQTHIVVPNAKETNGNGLLTLISYMSGITALLALLVSIRAHSQLQSNQAATGMSAYGSV